MRLSEGFVVGGQYRIVRLLAAGSKFRVYEADTETDGPGSVVVKVARHDEIRSLAGLEAGRARIHSEWEIQKRLHQEATSAAPLPIELVQMYPGDPDVRRVALLDKALVRQEPYLISEMADGQPLSEVLIGQSLDEERALLIGLRVVLLLKSARRLRVELRDFSPSNFIIDSAGENVSIVGFSTTDQPEDWHDYTGSLGGQTLWKASKGALPLGFGRLLVGLLAGMTAPEWGNTDEDLSRWERLLTSRRVPPEFTDLLLGALGYFERFEGTVDAVENRIRGLVRSPLPKVHKHPARKRDSAYLINSGERLDDRFRITKPLGQGGRGFVYRAIDEVSQVEVLIKANKYSYDAGSAFALELPTRRMELEHEFEVLKQFSSQTGMLPQPVALVRDTGRGSWFDLAPDLARNEPYVVMEYIKGIPLLDLLAKPLEGYAGATDPKNRLPPRFVCSLVAQVADLLAHFHAEGFLYQDLKPENVLYDPRAENVYMVDFAGACPRISTGDLDKKHVAFGVQTHGFAAPEFADLWERCDDRFDIYSLGATAYHLATGVNPERVAMESGEEYPQLSLSLLNTVAPPLATLIAKCLAPVESRLQSAVAVRDLAEGARLQLSRSRPLDVRAGDIEYVEDGVRIGWQLPKDPRITSLRVRRYGTDDDDVVTIHSGAAIDEVLDADPALDDQFYLIETGYERNGKVKHSRGQIVRVEAHPAPVAFEVEPYFESNRIRVKVAPQATSVAIRWSTDAPPVDLTEGEELAWQDIGLVTHDVAAGTTVHYAAFALYGDIASVPRFGSATAVGSVAEIGDVKVLQLQHGVSIEWEQASSNVLVHARRGSREERIAVPPNATEVVDLTPSPDEHVEYVVRLTRDGVTSDPIAEVPIQRWPSLPAFEWTALAGAVRATSLSAFSPRFTQLEVRVEGSSFEPFERSMPLKGAAERFRLSVAGNEELRIALRAIIDDGGPRVVETIVVPPVAPEFVLGTGDGHAPLLLSVGLPPSAVDWAGRYAFTLSADERIVDINEGTISELFQSLEDELVRAVFDSVPRAADDASYTASLTALTGEPIAEATHSVRVLEKLPEPVLVASLAAVTLPREQNSGDLPKLVDITLERAGGEETRSALSLPHKVELHQGERVRIRWRRTVVGEPMPWSDAAEVEALALPPTPEVPGVSLVDSMVTLAWSPVDLPDVQYVVRDGADGTTLYVGPYAQFRDVSGRSVSSYSLCSIRHGLESKPVSVAAPAVSSSASEVTALVRVLPEQRVRGLLASDDRLAQCVRVRKRAVAEIIGEARPRMIAVLAGPDEATLDRLVGELHGMDWLLTDGLAALAVISGRRSLVPWPSSRGLVRVLEASLEFQRPDWRMVAPAVEPVEGRLVGVTASDGTELVLSGSRGPLNLADTDALVVYKRNGTQARRLLRAGGVPPVVERALVLSGMGPLLAAASGLGLEMAQPAVLLAATHAPSPKMFPELVWQDVARGFPEFVAQRIEAEWRSPIAAVHPGNPLVLHYLQSGRPVELTISCVVVNAKGGARLMISVANVGGRARKELRVNLSRPGKYPRVIQRALSWLRDVHHGAEKEPPGLLSML